MMLMLIIWYLWKKMNENEDVIVKFEHLELKDSNNKTWVKFVSCFLFVSSLFFFSSLNYFG